jgi:hypothetical protein
VYQGALNAVIKRIDTASGAIEVQENVALRRLLEVERNREKAHVLAMTIRTERASSFGAHLISNEQKVLKLLYD